jgi:transcriptional/translational regulatory protein YebC/TACO1
VQSDEFEHIVYTQPTLLAPVAEQLRAKGFVLTSEKFTSIPRTPVVIEDLATAKQVLKLHDLLDDYDDTLNVFTNFELSDAIIDQLDS